MKYIILICLLCSSLLMPGLQLKAQKQLIATDLSEEYIKRNIAITKVKARVVADNTYVCEITVRDFNKTLPLPLGFGLKGQVFSDNGTGTDLVKGDGIYTAMQPMRFLNGQPKVLERNNVYYDQAFQYKSDVQFQSETQAKVGISCKIRRCGCPCTAGYTCRACEWWGWQCLELYECSVGIDF